MRLTRRPRAPSRQPMEAAARPLPSDDTTPPVTKMYFADTIATSLVVRFGCAWCAQSSIPQRPEANYPQPRTMPDTSSNFRIRLAQLADVPELHRLIEASVRGLQANDYTPRQIEGALGTALGLDTQLVLDATYFVAFPGEQPD